MKESLIEKWFPVKELSRDAAIEMAFKAVPAYIKHCRELGVDGNVGRNFYDPKLRSLHPWFARRPCSVSRAITLAALLPSSTSQQTFMKAIGWEEKLSAFTNDGYPPLLFYTDPHHDIISELLTQDMRGKGKDIVICDPMAGGGAIPLESLRLGFKSIAIDYNPIANLILKGSLEYPAKYGRKLAAEVINESVELITFAQRELSQFYPEDSEGYIIARGFNCPGCGGNVPLVKDTWLGGKNHLELTFDTTKKTYMTSIVKHETEPPYKGKKAGEIVCPYCAQIIARKQIYKLWSEQQVQILKELKNGDVNEEKILSTHVLLVRQIRRNYIPCNSQDERCFLNACKQLANSYNDLEKYMPTWQIPIENEVFTPITKYGIKSWHELFNPRQLLAVATLSEYVVQRSKYLLEEKGELGAAISLYLALGISRVTDYNSTLTSWKKGTIRDALGSYAQSRKMTYGEEYCEAIVPYRNLQWGYEPHSVDSRKTEGGICPIVNELCTRLEKSKDDVSIIQGDSRFLSTLLDGRKVDIINVDPPYFDQHTYSDISEYFWQVLKINLNSLVEAGYLYKDNEISNWKPENSSVPRDGELIVRHSATTRKQNEKQPFNNEWYANQMSIFFSECFKVLKDDGVLLLWFTHRSSEAWDAILSSLYAGGFYVTKLWPVTSELLTRLVSKGNNPIINQTLILICRKRPNSKVDEKNLEKHMSNLLEGITSTLGETYAGEHELEVFLRATATCAMTRVQAPQNITNLVDYFKKELVPKASKLYEGRTKQLSIF